MPRKTYGQHLQHSIVSSNISFLCRPPARRGNNDVRTSTLHDDAPGCLPSSPYLHIFGPISSILFGLSADALSTMVFCVDCPVHLSREGLSVVKADSEGWTVFLGRRVVLGVSSPDCNQNRTGLVRVGKQGMRVVTDGWPRRGGRRIDA